MAWLVLIALIVLGTSTVNRIAWVYFPPLTPLASLHFWVMVYVAAFLGLMLNHGINWISWMLRYRIFLTILLLGAAASFLWSLNPEVTIERTIHLFGGSIAAIYIGFTFSLSQLLRAMGAIFAVLQFMNIGAAVALPELGIEAYQGNSVWAGVFNSKNILGFWSAVCVLLYLALAMTAESRAARLASVFMIAVSLLTLVLSQSATSMVALIVAGGVVGYLYIVIRFRLGFVRMMVLVMLFMAVAVLAITNIDTAELLGRSSDMTGRGDIWVQTWALTLERPLGGYGYGALWFPDDRSIWLQEKLIDLTWIAHHAHNGLLQVASELGIPLAMIAILMVVQQMIEIIYCQSQRRQVSVLFVLAFAIMYLIGNISEARFMVTRDLIWFMFLALPISMLRQVQLPTVPENDEGGGIMPRTPAAVPPDKPWLRPGHIGPMPGVLMSRAPAPAALPGLAATASASASASASVEGAEDKLRNGLGREGPYAESPWTQLPAPVSADLDEDQDIQWRESSAEEDSQALDDTAIDVHHDRYDKLIDDEDLYDDTLELRKHREPML